MEVDQVLETIVAKVAEKFPAWNVSVRNDRSRDEVNAPAMLIECEAGNPSSQPNDEDTRIWVELDLCVKVVIDNLDEQVAALSAPKACAALSQFISAQTWGIENAKPAEWRGFFSEPFLPGLDHLAYWSVNWSQQFLLGDANPIHVDEVEELHLGLGPEHGADHLDYYVGTPDE